MKRVLSSVAALILVLAGYSLLVKASVSSVPTGMWVPTGDLSQPRAGAAAALLSDGVVLVTGGVGSQPASASAERYSAIGGTFVATAPMLTARTNHTATRLEDGRVLVVGGFGLDGAALGSAEIYNPGANAWAPAGNLSYARGSHTATLLPDGRVLVAGGENGQSALPVLEVFSPATESFGVVAASMSSPRVRHAAALTGKKVLLIGGWNGAAAVSSVDVYDSESDTVSVGPSLSIARAEHSATTLLSGNVLVAGGMTDGGELSSAEIYDAAAGQFVASVSSLSAPRRNHVAILLPHNNNVLISGGSSNGAPAAGAEMYREWQSAFVPAGNPNVARNWGVSSTLSFPASATNRGGMADGIAIAAGGEGSATAELYGFATIHTDKDDYSPGMTVYVSGSGWKPGPVTFYVRELPAEHSARIVTIDADAAGNIASTQLFVVEEHHAGVKFLLTTADGTSQAQIAFTDASLQVHRGPTGNPPDLQFTVTYQPFTDNLCTVGGGTIRTAVVNTDTGTALGGLGGGQGGFVKLTAPLNPTSPSGYVFKDWSSVVGSNNTITTSTSASICVRNPAGSQDDKYRATYQLANGAPTAANQSVTTDEDTAKLITLEATDPDGNSVTFSTVAGPAHGTLGAISAATCSGTPSNCTATVTYTPAANYSGPDSFTFKANDGTLDSNTATVSITVNPVNDAPVAVDDSYSTNEDTPLNQAAPGVLANDTDVDGSSLTAGLVSGPSHGTLTLNSNGSFTYTPAANYSGPDTFTYKANDGAADSNIATVSITVNAVNDAPVAVNDSYSTNEDTPLSVAAPGVLTNDTDGDGGSLTAVLVSGPTHGTLTLNGDGSFTYTPAANYNGPDSFTYKANDGGADSNVATVSLTINAVNDAPVAVNDSYSTNEDTALTITAPGVLGNDTDAEGDTLSAVLVTGPSHGTLTLNGNGSFTYTPAANYNGSDSFTYKANDGSTDSNAATVSLTINAVNDAPVATNDTYSTNEDTPLSIVAPGVLGNDTDVEGSSLTAALISGPSHGTLTLNSNGSFTYTPAANYHGSDSFTYKANDGSADSNPATVSLTINPVNDAPVAVGDSYSTNEDTALTVTAPGVLGNDTDVDGDTLSAALVTPPAHGTLTLNADGSFIYSPAANYNGPDSFTYKANDGSADSTPATVSLTINPVNDAPVAAADSYSTNEDTPLTVSAPGVLANDTDVESDPLTAAVVGAPAHGTLTLNANGSFTYTPAANYNGPDSFTYKASDGAADSAPATVSLTINPVNDAPVAVGDSYSTNEDTALTVSVPGVLGNDSDVDGDTLSAVLVTGPAHGALALNSNGSFTYTPAANYNGADSFTYKANDGSADSNTATVSLTIVPVNDAPMAGNDSYSTNEDTALSVIAPGVLGNDTDVEGSALTAVLVGGPSHGTLTLNANGSFTYTPAANYNGPDSFTYKANDGELDSNVATVSLTIIPVNDAPVAANDNYSTNEDTLLSVAAPGVLANDTDIDGPTLTAMLVSGPAHGTLTLNANGSFTYSPAANYNGPDSFTYKANDGELDSNVATVSLTVIPVNDAPMADNDSYSTNEDTLLSVAAPGVLGNDTDIDSPTLTAALVSGPSHGTVTLNMDGSFTYTPAANYNGPDSFTYKANDGELDSNVATVSLTVIPVNDAPVAADDSYSTDEDTTLIVSVPGVLANDLDVDGDALAAVLVSGPAHGALTLNANGSFTYTPAANYNGPDSFTYRANDGSANSNVATVAITVNSVNDAPVAANDSYTTNEDTTLNVAAPGVLGNDTDIDSPTLTAVFVSGPSHGTVTLNPNGSFTYTPAANYNGPDSFTYKANDGTTDSNVATVSITVNAVNDAPVAANDTYSTSEDTTLNVAAPGVLGNDSDIDSASLTAVLVSSPSHGTVTLSANGSFTYTPAANYNGPDSFTYKANDGAADSNLATVSLTINPVNDPPVINPSSLNATPGVLQVLAMTTFSGSFSDADLGDTPPDTHVVTVSWDDGTTSPATISGSGSTTRNFSATHTYATAGVYTVSVTVTDRAGAADTETYQFVVVYDPSAGFVTGGGWIMSPPTACRLTTCSADPTGKANFGFVSKYKKGSDIPEGRTEFQFQAGGLNFHSLSYDLGSLVVASFKAQYRGTGEINGEPGYNFVLTAYDGQINGGGGVDRFRMKITKGGVTVYDNRMGASDDVDLADPMAISGGSIVIHK